MSLILSPASAFLRRIHPGGVGNRVTGIVKVLKTENIVLQKDFAKSFFVPTYSLQVSTAQIDEIVSASYAKKQHAAQKQAEGVTSRSDPQLLYRLKCEIV